MRCLYNLLTLSSSILIWTLKATSARSAIVPDNLQQPFSLPFPIPHVPQYAHVEKSHNDRRLLVRIRNRVVQALWKIPIQQRLSSGSPESALRSSPPAHLLARYGEDLVLRFKIRSVEEAKALADAINVLFLDVWEFTTEWVDIRLAKDVVRLTPKQCGALSSSDFP